MRAGRNSILLRASVAGCDRTLRVAFEVSPPEPDVGVGGGYEVLGIWDNRELVRSKMWPEELEALLRELDERIGEPA